MNTSSAEDEINPTENSDDALINAMKQEHCVLHDTGLTQPFDHDISPEMIKEIAYWENFTARKRENYRKNRFYESRRHKSRCFQIQKYCPVNAGLEI